jgi:hypothetical protein
MCWYQADLQQICHPVADRRVPGYTIQNTQRDNLDSTLSIKYPGAWNWNMEILSTCDRGAPFDLDIADSTVVYQDSLNGPEFTFGLRSSYTCPRSFRDPWYPNVSRPSPPSGAKQISKIQAVVGEGKNARHFGLNLLKIRSVVDRVIVGEFGTMTDLHKAELFYSPWDRVGCPDNKDCGTYSKDLANVWKCVGSVDYERCYPIADRNYGVNLTSFPPLFEDGVPPIQAKYSGGVDDWSVEFNFGCDPNGTLGHLNFSHWGREEGWPPVLSIWVSTAEVCKEVEWGVLSGGAVFLLIVFSLVLLYFGAGTVIVYASSGVITIPFGDFWLEVWDSFYTAILFLVTCGRAAPSGPVYDRV